MKMNREIIHTSKSWDVITKHFIYCVLVQWAGTVGSSHQSVLISSFCFSSMDMGPGPAQGTGAEPVEAYDDGEARSAVICK